MNCSLIRVVPRFFVDHNKTGAYPVENREGRRCVPYQGDRRRQDLRCGSQWGLVCQFLHGGKQKGKTTVDPLIDKNTAGYENAEDEWKFVAPGTYEVFKPKNC